MYLSKIADLQALKAMLCEHVSWILFGAVLQYVALCVSCCVIQVQAKLTAPQILNMHPYSYVPFLDWTIYVDLQYQLEQHHRSIHTGVIFFFLFPPFFPNVS